MNKIEKILGNAAVAVVVMVNAEVSDAIEVKQFNARVYETANMAEITKQDPFLTVVIKVLQDSYRAHLDELREKKNPSDLLREDNYKYFLTLYDVIPTELAKMVFCIKAQDDGVNYVNKSANEVIECISGEGIIYKEKDKYSASNWNYLLLINVLNQVKNGTQEINKQLIQNTADMIANHGDYSKYASQLQDAVYDIQQYFDELELYEYLGAIKKFNFKEMIKRLKSDEYDKFYTMGLNNITITINKKQWDTIIDLKSVHDAMDRRKYDIWYKTNEKPEYEISTKMTYYLYCTPECIAVDNDWAMVTKELKMPLLNLFGQSIPMYDFLIALNHKAVAKEIKLLRKAAEALLNEAENYSIEYEGDIFLTGYFLRMYDRFLCPNYYKDKNEFIHFTCTDKTLIYAQNLIENLCGKIEKLSAPNASPEEKSRAINEIENRILQRYNITYESDTLREDEEE